MKRWLVLLFVLVSGYALAASSKLPAPLARAAKAAGIPLDEIGIVVQPIEARRPRLTYNAQRAMNPASAMKLVTTAVALHTLGPAHLWRTEIYADGPIFNGTLQGNLVIKGAGDPKLTLEEFWLLLTKLRTRGVRDIAGDLILDRTLIPVPSGHSGDFDGDALRPYNALPDALLINFNAIRLDFIPRSDSQAVEITALPHLPSIPIFNRLRLTAESCTQWPQDPAHDPLTGALTFTGAFPLDCGETSRNYSPVSTTAYVESLFRQQWTALGGSLTGKVRDGVTPPSAIAVVAQDSEPLVEVIRDINKFSNNVMARQLFLSLGSLLRQTPWSTTNAEKFTREWLRDAGLDFPELVMENGSGLSRRERISPANLARLLQWAARSPLAPEFIASLPITGTDGTMRKRLTDSTVAGRAHIKTGYLDGVRASAGFVLDDQGRLVALVCIVNGASANGSKDFHDALIQWAYTSRTHRP